MRSLAGARCWSVGDSDDLYHIAAWGSSYFSINSRGNLCVSPDKQQQEHEQQQAIELTEVIRKATEKGMQLPLIVRFPQILNSRMHELHGAFSNAIAASGGGRFQGVYPVKCNPDRFLVEDIVKFGRDIDFGLEAGSKPELILAMACMCKASPDALLICNGYKDAEYIKLAFTARQLGLNCVLVLEQEQELDLIIEATKVMDGVRPVVGLRAKLSTKHGGHWGDTSGENGKFGLSAMEIVDIVHKLRKNEMLDCLQLLHFHVGSQIPSLSILKEGVTEAAHILCDLKLMGAAMKYLDVGGGLGIDYDGSKSSASHMSVGYSLEEYAAQVVEAIAEACSVKKNDQLPILCCESGRGLVSHHSVLVFDVYSACRRGSSLATSKGDVDKVKDLVEQLEGSLPEEILPTWQQLVAFIQEGSYAVALDFSKGLKCDMSCLFKAGLISLHQRALMEKLCELLGNLVEENLPVVGGWKFESSSKLPVTYNMNISMFKSLPDTWAIGQLFPILPLQRLNEEPTASAILSDLTCDSDGRIRDFMAGEAFYSKSLPVHSLEPGKPYYIGVFLGGAYQEALSSMHNLFGGMNVVHVLSSGCGGTGPEAFWISREVPGQTIASVLRLVQHDPSCMFDALRSRLIKALHEGRFDNDCDARLTLQSLARTFSSYPYLASDYKEGKQQEELLQEQQLLQRKQRSCFDSVCSPMDTPFCCT